MPTKKIPFHAHSTAADVLAGLDLTGRRMVVTGGGAGIGAEITRTLLDAGAEVTIGVRSPESVTARLAAELGNRVRVETLDLADLRSVRRFSDRWTGTLDALIANAGVMAIPELERAASGWEQHLAVNFLGHFSLIRGLHASLASAAGRIVVVSSGAHRDAPMNFDDPQFLRRDYDRWNAYAQSKTADILLAVEASRRWATDGITANAVNPGWVMTDLQRHIDDATMRQMGAMDDNGEIIEQPYSKTLAEGAAPSVLLAASPLTATVTGCYIEDNQIAPVTVQGPGGVAPHAVDALAAKRLWALAENVTDL
ncbi:SDR family NAD(P)-dependent oxidoreductase [Rhodococcus sp. 1R11]|uniref:SDR family NAD(P)-dependent oxidoreductase n=1 Tax=Rhodococcus sp. 1R11 TaxID=2559614 RepID=UPI001071A77E|nr:SDR family NAD(P)-dependent oxidoreductase [Rhodococcus sp. 1R11]MBX5331872.1 SDR family NAD(P)-dependent oxidoreductase [Rhodococcus fascians]MBY4058090.1 SDR family NAD(P)-dependent oxidoreductase [Rhodococcus fascians]MBY4069733.1 SDR family NAD(P)-dependent oxidoreductase [Rhodococcus fascians]TFI44835.1 SDR family NAD(P)-dependent oxidoreductase [Rhodococcus sp. 1R11]